MKLVVVGGSYGLGAAFIKKLQNFYDEIVDIDKSPFLPSYGFNKNVSYKKFDLEFDNIIELKEIVDDADFLILCAGIGNIRRFENYNLGEINKTIKINLTSLLQILLLYYPSILTRSKKCIVVSSIAGRIDSPLFVPYSSSKFGLSAACRALNIELKKSGSKGKITCLEPLKIDGTSFYGGQTDFKKIDNLVNIALSACESGIEQDFCGGEDIFLKATKDPEFGEKSFDYKMLNNRLSKTTGVIGYLSGTFDLFHIGHLNLIKRARECCDYLVVGIHPSGSWKGKETFIPFDERVSIIKSLKYVDDVIEAPDEDIDAYNLVKFDKLFVGSDYKGSQRFLRYEKELSGKAQIVYFEYTTSTNSTMLRQRLKNNE